MTSEGPSSIHPDLESLAKVMGADEWDGGDDWAEFNMGDMYVDVNVIDQVERIHIRVYFGVEEERAVRKWVERQPPPRSGLLGVEHAEEHDWFALLVFERPTHARDWSTDPLLDDVKHYTKAWLKDETVLKRSVSASYEVEHDPRNVPAASAWLLKGDESSYPSTDELSADREAAAVGIFAWDWTSATQTQFGDLALFYFMAPRKAVNFVARAASNAYFNRDISVTADKKVTQTQWWACFTTPIEIEPISVATLRGAVGGYLPLRGRSGHYLPPEVIRSLQFRAVNPADQAELDRIVSVPVGLSHLPDPADITEEIWRELAAGALPLEDHVSSHLVEPLLRLLLDGTELTWRREYPIARRWADFVILDGARPVHVIEVKKVIRTGLKDRWSESPDFKQLRWYADQLGTGGTLIDSHRVVLLKRGAEQPEQEFTRREASRADLNAIRQHLLER